MRTACLALALSVLTVAGCRSSATTATQPEAPNSELDSLQGTWVAESAERRGAELPADRARKIRVVVGDDTLEFSEGDRYEERARFSVDAEPSPMHIDVEVMQGPDRGKTALGIYRIHGDRLEICWAEPGKPRPMAFSTKGGKASECLRLRRAD